MPADEATPLNYAPPAPPRWAGAVSAAVGAMAVLWLSAGLALYLLGDDPAAGAKAAKYVLLACVPSSLVGVILGGAGLRAGSRLAVAGLATNGLTLLAALATAVLAYAARLT